MNRLTVLCAICAVAASPALAAGPNLIANAGFEQADDGDPSGWEPSSAETLGATDGALDDQVVHSGERSLRLVREDPEGWGFFTREPIAVDAGVLYDFGGWMRMEDVVRHSYPGAFFLLHILGAGGEVITQAQTAYAGGTEGWREWSGTVTMPEDAAQVKIYLEFSVATGTVWFDDVYLRRSDARPLRDEPAPTLTRAVWVSKRDFATPEDADALIERAQRCNLNVLLPNVYGHGSVMYRSEQFPMYGSVPEGFDPLAHIIERAHEVGIEVHPWFNVVRGPLEHLDEDRTWMFYWSAERERWFGGWADVHRPEFRDWVVALMLDCCERYEVDGLHYDYIRAGVDCHCPACVTEFEAQFGHGMEAATNSEWATWHGQAVTDIVRRTTLGLREIRPDAITSAAVQNAYAGPRGGQDGPGWVREGILDVLMPMDYRGRTAEIEVNERNWIQALGGTEHLCTGLSLYRRERDDDGNLHAVPRNADLVDEQVRRCGRLGIPGVTLFASVYLSDEIVAALSGDLLSSEVAPHVRRDGWRTWAPAPRER